MRLPLGGYVIDCGCQAPEHGSPVTQHSCHNLGCIRPDRRPLQLVPQWCEKQFSGLSHLTSDHDELRVEESADRRCGSTDVTPGVCDGAPRARIAGLSAQQQVTQAMDPGVT